MQRKAVDRDRYERDLALQARVRESYRAPGAPSRAGSCSTASAPKDAIAADVFSAVASRLALP